MVSKGNSRLALRPTDPTCLYDPESAPATGYHPGPPFMDTGLGYTGASAAAGQRGREVREQDWYSSPATASDLGKSWSSSNQCIVTESAPLPL
jgi:hypothetical protein